MRRPTIKELLALAATLNEEAAAERAEEKEEYDRGHLETSALRGGSASALEQVARLIRRLLKGKP